MTDEQIEYSKTLIVERRIVRRNKHDKLYYVVERQGMGWLSISKGYAHSTSAYAKLGRITAHQSLHRV